jgi:hypothetical protein
MPLGMADGTLSRQIWGNFPWASADSPHFKGTFFYDKFNKGLGQWTTFIDTGGTITPSVDLANDEFGAVELTTDADDNQAVEMQAGQAGAMAKFINPAVTAAYDIYFEARFSLGAVVGNCFVGLMEYVTPAGDHITDAGALRDSDFIGFSTLEATPTILELTHKEEGSTVVVDGAIETLAADEVVQVGFVYRPNLHPASRWVTVYETNVRSAVAISKATCLLSTFPMGVAAAGDQKLMCPTIAVKNVTDITSLRCEWIACGMVPS